MLQHNKWTEPIKVVTLVGVKSKKGKLDTNSIKDKTLPLQDDTLVSASVEWPIVYDGQEVRRWGWEVYSWNLEHWQEYRPSTQ